VNSVSAAALLAAKIFLLAIAISMAVAVLIGVLGRVTAAAGGAARRARPPAESRQAAAPTDEDILVIAAAVHAVFGAHRIVHIEQRGSGHLWSVSGRSAHHGSHNTSPPAKRPVLPPPRS
jgi:hypothetical protein